MRSPLMVRTAAKAAATATAGIGSVKQLPSAIRPAITSLRTITLAGYRVTNAAGGKAPMMIWAGIIALVGIALAIQQSTLLGMGGLIFAAIGMYLIVFGAWQTSRLALTAAISVTITGLIASLALPVVRRGLFGTGSDTDLGWVGKHVNHVINWLATSWWHPLVAVAVILLLPAAGILALNSFRKRTAHHSPKPTPKPGTVTSPLSNASAPEDAQKTQGTQNAQKTPERPATPGATAEEMPGAATAHDGSKATAPE
jgi:hypothetical protein